MLHFTIRKTEMAILLYIFLLTTTSLPSIPKPSIISVSADEIAMQRECHNSNAPKTCVQCLKSDNRSLKADKYTIATLVIECLDKHATSLGRNMSVLATRIPDVHNASRRAYEGCVRLFSQATKELGSAAKEIKNGEYDSADKSVFNARRCNLECFSSVGSKGKVKLSEVLIDVDSEMMVFEQLSEATMRIIERF